MSRLSLIVFVAAFAAVVCLLITAFVDRSGTTAVMALVCMTALTIAAKKQWRRHGSFSGFD
jgi:hypothetical protein